MGIVSLEKRLRYLLMFVIQHAFDCFAQVNDIEFEQQTKRFVRQPSSLAGLSSRPDSADFQSRWYWRHRVRGIF